ncbi:unnamed protein product [Phytophthora fragariaefolia]|uniref:Unnamed protein product n=1 Tax=Phytophthora fragariaefolia TaxID=1490495 RepID=A0A9W7CZI9_9STRA|nr:unnamed protein product [Phytophthora fragariaefolia]
MVFLAEDSVGIYKFDAAFKKMERIKIVESGMCLTLTGMPFVETFLVENSLYVMDSAGLLQAVDIEKDQTSIVIETYKSADIKAIRSRLLSFPDNLVIGVVSIKPTDAGAFIGELSVVSRDDHRKLPILALDKKFLSDQVSVQCIDDVIFVLDPLAKQVHMFSISVHVQSDGFRVRECDDEDMGLSGNRDDVGVSLRKRHLLYTFYHVFEKFPVIGVLDERSTKPVSIPITCLFGDNSDTTLEDCHDYFSLLMSDLMALNKELSGLDLTRNFIVQRASSVKMPEKPLHSFLQALITFLPIQVCRAEANALTILRDGVDQPPDSLDMEPSTWGSAAIAESIRFGLLSPVLRAWQGRCIVITSMGKQSTGKSYFLNHFTGSSFAIAGKRCTDGAWMTLRIL